MASVASLFSLNGRTALITGGTRGIGQAMAFALAEAGADIILVQRDESNTATRDEIINRLGRKAHIHVAELSDRKSVKEIVPSVTSQGWKPDILVTCAGIQRRHPSHQFPDEDWDEVSSLPFFFFFFFFFFLSSSSSTSSEIFPLAGLL